MSGQTIAFGPFVFDADSGSLFRDGEMLAIGQKGALLLKALVTRPGGVRTKTELMDAAWPGVTVEENNLAVQIGSLRRLLGSTPGGGEWIVTVPRVGYRFVSETHAPEAVNSPGSPSKPVAPSLAVMPFQNLSGDPEQAYFADGVVEDIITALSRFTEFAVIARNSSFAYKGRSVDVRQIASELGVRYVLEGSVRRTGDQLRITAQLVDGTTGTHLWARNFDGVLEDVFDFQDKVTESIAMLVEPRIQAAEIQRSRRKPPESMAAYDLYLQALPKLYAETWDANEEAYQLLTRALSLEPDNGPILIHAAWALGHRPTMGWPPLTKDDRSKGAELARRGLDHAEGDARVMALSALRLLHVSKDNDLAMAVIRTAVDTNPNDIAVVFPAGIVHLHAGDVEKALEFFHRAIRLSPIDPAAHYSLTGIAHAYMILGDFDAALAWATRSLAVNANFLPTYWMLIAANAQLGRMDEAHRLLDAFRKTAPRATIASIRSGQPQGDPSRLAAIFAGLRLAGLAEG